MSSKINWLVNNTNPGAIVLQSWLTQNGISPSLVRKYVSSGWLNKIRAGVYVRPESTGKLTPTWVEALNAMNEQLELSIHLAGVSSLTHQGLSHYLQLGREQVWVGCSSKQALPKWFREFDGQNWLFYTNNKLTQTSEKDFITITVNNRDVKASSAELAAYEVVNSIGKHISFEHTAELFQGLVNLSPRRVQSILNRSEAVQTNRLFLFLSHYYQHQWAKRLDESQIYLGSGKRQVVLQGRYDERYQITVPVSFINSKEEKQYG